MIALDFINKGFCQRMFNLITTFLTARESSNEGQIR